MQACADGKVATVDHMIKKVGPSILTQTSTVCYFHDKYFTY